MNDLNRKIVASGGYRSSHSDRHQSMMAILSCAIIFLCAGTSVVLIGLEARPEFVGVSSVATLAALAFGVPRVLRAASAYARDQHEPDEKRTLPEMPPFGGSQSKDKVSEDVK